MKFKMKAAMSIIALASILMAGCCRQEPKAEVKAVPCDCLEKGYVEFKLEDGTVKKLPVQKEFDMEGEDIQAIECNGEAIVVQADFLGWFREGNESRVSKAKEN